MGKRRLAILGLVALAAVAGAGKAASARPKGKATVLAQRPRPDLRPGSAEPLALSRVPPSGLLRGDRVAAFLD